MLRGVGSKWVAIAALVLGVGLISYFGTQFIRESERDEITIELQETTDERRKVIKDAIKADPPATPDDASNSLRYLRDRQGRN